MVLHEAIQCALNAWWCLLSYGIAFRYFVREFFGRKSGRFTGLKGKELSRSDGKHAVVTGGSRGIGFEVVSQLLESGYKVVVGSSSTGETRQKLEHTLREKFPQASIEIWYLDLASMKSVKEFAESYIASQRPLDLLINNAGIMFVKESITEDGYEKHFAVNYLSHCLLTLLLLPLLNETGTKDSKSRIINCSSCIHFAGKLDIENLGKGKYYSKYKAYIESKLCQIMFTYSLQSFINAENMNVTANSIHPGIVNTELMTKELLFPKLGRILFKSSKEGAETAIFTALSPDVEGVGGKYLEECEIVNSSAFSQDGQLQRQLWELTLTIVQPWIHDKNLLAKS